MKIFHLFFALLGLISINPNIVVAQTGPGGIGDGSGTNGPRNVLWLDASSLALSNNASVASWPDLSGNGNTLTQQGSDPMPIFRNDGLASGTHKVVRFDGTERYLRIVDNASLDGFDGGVTILVVARFSVVDNNPRGILSKRVDSSTEEAYSIFTHTGSKLNFDVRTTGDNRLTGTTTLTAANDYILTSLYNRVLQYEVINTTIGATRSEAAAVANASSDLILGALNDNYGTYLNADLAEVIVYGDGLNRAERLIVENYLAEKYAIVITNDYYGSAYKKGITGIGRSAGESNTRAISSGLVLTTYDGSITDGEFLMTGHLGGSNSVVSDSVTGLVTNRWSKSWFLQKTGTLNATIGFDFSDGISGQFPQELADYRLLKRNGTTYEIVTTASVSATGDQLLFNVEDANLTNGFYTLGTVNNSTAPLLGGAQRVWYSYRSGNWQDPVSWTLDGSIVPLYVNPNNEIPSATDKVVINTGKTISARTTDGSANLNNLSVSSMQVIGSLNLGTSNGHNFTNIIGTGKIILEGSQVDDSFNFPSGDASLFNSATGGTLELKGNGLLLGSTFTANNLIVNLIASGDLAVLSNSMTLNGDLTISSGTFQINNNASTTALTLNIAENIQVTSTGNITTGSANARHQLNMSGNFTNDGSVKFTQRTTPTYNSEATDGIVDVNFINDNEDQFIQCNGVTHFYRILIDKGEDDTYRLNIDAENAGDFNLNGFANQGHADIAQLVTNTNALGLLKGTVRIGDNVTIPQLNNGGNYNVSAAAKIWVDGGSVTKSAGTAIVPYGGVQVSSGTLTASINSGITTRGNGYLNVSGGKVLMNQFRTSVFGASNQGGYSQSGGEVYVSGGSTSTDYYTFSLTYEGNSFSMSGGVLTVNSNSRGGIFINGDDGNFNVTGGEVIAEIDTNDDFIVTSKAPFYQFRVRKVTNNTGYVILDGGTSAFGSADPRTLAAQPLIVYDDLIIKNSTSTYVNFAGVTTVIGRNADFRANGIDITVTGNIIEEEGASFTTGNNTITSVGDGTSFISFSSDATQVLHNLSIKKDQYYQGLRITGGNATAAFSTSGQLSVETGKLEYRTFNINALGNINLQDTVGAEGFSGKLRMIGASAQNITSNGIGAIFNLEIDNVNGVSLIGGGLALRGTLTLTNGIFNIGTQKLRVRNAIAGTGFGVTRMVQTSGNVSDGGIEMRVASNGSYFYPLGTNANASVRYTPANMVIANYADDGYVQIRMSDTELQTVNQAALSNNMLTYYWRVSHSNFSVLPTVTSLQFTAAISDDPQGDAFDANFVPGKVLDVSPFTRSQESISDIAGYVITFDGVGSGFTLEKANYTAGDGSGSLFSGTPRIYYTADRTTTFPGRNWNDANTWSTVGHYSTTNTGTFPQTGDIVFIGFSPQTNDQTQRSHWVFLNVNVNVAQITFRGDSVQNASSIWINRNTSFTPQLTIADDRGAINLGVVSGEGTFSVEVNCTTCNADPNISVARTANITADFGDFSANLESRFDYELEFANNRSVRLPLSFPEIYPNVHIKGANGTGRRLIIQENILVNGDLFIRERGILQLHTGASGDIEVKGDLNFTINNADDILEFPSTGTPRILTIHGDILMEDGDADVIQVLNTTPSGLVHILRLGGSIDQQSGNTLDFFTNNTGGNNVLLELFGAGNKSYTTDNNTIDLFRIKMNKGIDTTSSFTFLSNFTLGGTTNNVASDDKAIVLASGKLVFDNASVNVVLTSGGSSFRIPSGSGLEMKQGTANVTGAGMGILLDGLLKVSGGILNMDGGAGIDNFIEYSSSGSAKIEITSGTLTVGSQVRRSLTSTGGILHFNQSGGNFIVGKNAAPSTSRGVFEVANSGSFTRTGGDFTIVRGINSTFVPSLLISPSTSSLGGTITIGNADTPSGSASSLIGIKSSVALNSLTINNSSGNNPTVKIYSLPLTLNGTLTVQNGATLSSNGFDLTLKGDFVNNGTYLPVNGATIFSGTGAQSYSGTGTSNFYNLTRSNSGILSLSQDITIDNEFLISSGSISHGTNSIFVAGDATIQSTLTATGGNGLVLNGTAQQILNGKGNTNVNIGILTLDNSEGVAIADGNGFSFTITDRLRLSQGVLDIGGSLLTIGQNGSIEEVNLFSASNMIQTNSSFADNGVKKIFGGAETGFIFPVGEVKYTPLELLNITTAPEVGSTLTVRPANETHPVITDDSGTAEDETRNVLKYHWVVKSSGISSSVVGEARFTYDQSDIINDDFAESSFVSARLTSGSSQWDKVFPTIDATNNRMTFPLAQSSTLAGEYTLGTDNAFRDVPVFRSVGNVSFSSSTNWEISTDGGTTYNPALDAPIGAIITVQSGDTLVVDQNNVRLLSTTIDNGGRLVIDPAFYGTRLGEVSGQGTLVLQNEVFPSGNYEDFLTCSGGEIEYASSTNFQVLAGISNIRAVKFSGSGTLTFSSNIINVCEDLVIDGPTVVKESANALTVEGNLELISGTLQFSSSTSKITVEGNTILTGGTFTGFSGADITFNGNLTKTGTVFTGNSSDFLFNGTGTQVINGSFSWNKLVVNNSGGGIDFTSGTGGNMTISGSLTMTDGVITTSATNKITLGPSATKSGASIACYFNGPLLKQSIAASSTYTFPVGKGGRYAPIKISNVQTGSQNWNGEYFTSIVDATIPTTAAFDDEDPGSGYNALFKIQQNDRWNLTSSGSNTAFITATYGAHNAFPSSDVIRVIWWNASQSRWENQGGIITGTSSSGSVASENSIGFSSQEFGLGNAPESLLPVDLLHFDATSTNKVVELKWSTASELDNDRFEIQKSNDGISFKTIGTVLGNGTTNELHHYDFVDSDPEPGINYYRLKQLDYDGAFDFSPLVYVIHELDNQKPIIFNLYPNPTFNNKLTLSFESEVNEQIQIQLVDLMGKIYFEQQVTGTNGEIEISPKAQTIAPGMYYLLLNHIKGYTVQKVLFK